MSKQQERAMIEAQMAKFLSQGGQVSRVGSGKSGLDAEGKFKLRCAVYGDDYARRRKS